MTKINDPIAHPDMWFYPGEELAEDQIRVTLMGTGSGHGFRQDQKGPSMFVELGRVQKADGSAVIIAGCPEGLGIHYLSGVGMRGHEAYDRDKFFGGHCVIIYSPNLSYPEVKQRYPPDTLVFNHWREVVEELQ